MKNRLISIIVPCYNQAHFLSESLQSVLNQTYTNWECVIVNDGSSDNTEEIALKWCEKDTRFRYVYKKNGGLSSARNFGIEIAIGVYILPLDADDKISFNYLEKCYSEIEKSDTIKVVYGIGYKFGAEKGKWNLTDYTFENLLKNNVVFCTALYRKTDWETIGGYDENMKYGYEDWEFWVNLLKSGGEVIQNKDCIFYYRIKKESMLTSLIENESKKYKMNQYIFEKHIECYKLSLFDLYYTNKKLESIKDKPEQYFTFLSVLKILFIKLKLKFL